LTKCSRRIRPIVSTTSIPHRPPRNEAGSPSATNSGGQFWTPIPRLRGQYSTPKHSHGVTCDKLLRTAAAYIRPETYKAALARIINAHHALPVAAIWGDGTTSSSDRQFFRSAKRGDAAGEVNARYGQDPDLGFYTHVSDQHDPYSVRVMSATSHEAPYVLDDLLHHGTALQIDTHYTDTGDASDHVFILCAMLGIRFCPRLRDFPDRKARLHRTRCGLHESTAVVRTTHSHGHHPRALG
jgi:TnpA family transposase